MGWSCCQGYWKSVGSVTSRAVKKWVEEYNKGKDWQDRVRLSPKPLTWSQLGHENRFNANAPKVEGYPDGYCCDCDKITNLKIDLETWGEKYAGQVVEVPFKCACLKKPKPKTEEYKGLTLYIHTKRRKFGKYYEVVISKEGSVDFSQWGGYDRDALVSRIKEEIDKGTLKGVYGNPLVVKEA